MDFSLISPNVSACQRHRGETQIDQTNEALFWTAVTISSLIVIFGAIANILVIYFASQEPWTGKVRHLNKVVKHLAVSDLLYGVIGHPLVLLYWKRGKT